MYIDALLDMLRRITLAAYKDPRKSLEKSLPETDVDTSIPQSVFPVNLSPRQEHCETGKQNKNGQKFGINQALESKHSTSCSRVGTKVDRPGKDTGGS